MPHTPISVENLGKKYFISHKPAVRNNSVRDALSDGATALCQRLFSPFRNSKTSSDSEEFWALRDVSFRVKQGKVVGIIGSNGAGKSTLLKIFSRITEPTTGTVRLRGRVASLLEVGTGFHPELTGRENIFLNGAILGMTKQEIKAKFDEIVAFAETEKFLDTPVKRYSSGMYIRLAFAVAAHLESDILLVDEVLAVGDAAFQKKCLGKMGDVSRQGRTIIFVSHNMSSISLLCDSALWLECGTLRGAGGTENIIRDYLSKGTKDSGEAQFDEDPLKLAQIKSVTLLDRGERAATDHHVTDQIRVKIEYRVKTALSNHRVGVVVTRHDGMEVFVSNSNDPENLIKRTEPGEYMASLIIPGRLLNSGQYLLGIYLGEPNVRTHDQHDHLIKFSVYGSPFKTIEKRRGLLAYPFHWETHFLSRV